MEEMLSSKKYTPIRAMSHNRLIFGTNKSNIPIVAAKIPINKLNIEFNVKFLLINMFIILYKPYEINTAESITPKDNEVSFGRINKHKLKIINIIPSIKMQFNNLFSDIISSF